MVGWVFGCGGRGLAWARWYVCDFGIGRRVSWVRLKDRLVGGSLTGVLDRRAGGADGVAGVGVRRSWRVVGWCG